MSRFRPALLAAAMLALASGCGRRSVERKVDIPAGDAVRLAAGAADPDLEGMLSRGGFASVFVPAARLSAEGATWTSTALPPPARPFQRPAVFLVIESDPPGSTALGTPERAAAWGRVLWVAVESVLAGGSRFGRVAGVHLDIPFAPGEVSGMAAAAASLRSKLPAGMPLTLGLKVVPGEKERESWETLARSVDGFVAHVFGPGGGATPASADQLGRPWWAEYAPAVAGSWRDAGGEERGSLPEEVFARLTDDNRVEFLQNISLKEDAEATFQLKPRQPVTVGRWTFPAGSRLTFRQPSLTDMLDRMGGDVAGRRFVRGRVVQLPGVSDGERIFTLASLVAVLSGGVIEPDWKATLQTGRGFLELSAENPTANASAVSRTTNWVEVDVPGAGVTDVQSGGFDRYEVFGADGNPVLPGRATRVRFYETLVGPFEKIAPARISVRRIPPDCCSMRVHLLAATGKEISR